MFGTLVNVGAILIGGIIGVVLRSRLPEKVIRIVFQALGLFTLFIGFLLATKTTQFLIMIFSLVGGSIIGELIDIEQYLNRFSEYLKTKVKSKNERFSEGMVTAFLMYCMGSMTILGAFEEGLGGFPNLLIAKSLLDGFSSIALAAGLGIGVLFSVVPLLVYQGGLTLVAIFIGNLFPQFVIDELSAVGGLLLIGMGINILEIKKIRVVNMLPALVFAIVIAFIYSKLG